MPRIIMIGCLVGLLITSMNACGPSEGNYIRSMGDGLTIKPDPDSIFPLFGRHSAVVKGDDLNLRVWPTARPNRGYFRVVATNSGNSNIWLEPSETNFFISPNQHVDKIWVSKAKYVDNGYVDDGFVVTPVEIPAKSERWFYIYVFWHIDASFDRTTRAELRLIFSRPDKTLLPLVVKFMLGPYELR